MRCFIAVDVEDSDILDSLEDAQKRLEGTGANLKCVERENIHLTMRFLGDVREGLLEGLKSLIHEMNFNPFQMELNGVGAFPNLRRPGVIWVGVSKGVDELTDIYNRLEKELVGMGFKSERRGLSPHITLARVRSGRNRAQLVEEVLNNVEESFGSQEVKGIRLKKSVLTPQGPIYSTLAESIS